MEVHVLSRCRTNTIFLCIKNSVVSRLLGLCRSNLVYFLCLRLVCFQQSLTSLNTSESLAIIVDGLHLLVFLYSVVSVNINISHIHSTFQLYINICVIISWLGLDNVIVSCLRAPHQRTYS